MEYFTLTNGIKMPANGYGVYQVSKEDCKASTLAALKAGYRHIDTAQAYMNEEEVGLAIKESGINREEIFVTTKVWITNYGEGKTYNSVIESLNKLQLDYVDLILLHQPIGDYYSAYRDIEKLYKEGKVKSIGVSNFYPDRLVDLCLNVEIPPMVNQIEINPFFQREEDLTWANKYHVVLQAWAPFAEGRNNLFKNETLAKIGAKYNKSVAQVVLRWLYQRGIVSLAKSVHENRIIENNNIYDFSLSEEDMKTIKGLDTPNSMFFNHQTPEIVEWFGSFFK